MIDVGYIDIVPLESVHTRLGLAAPLTPAAESEGKAFSDWRMEIDDAPMLRYLYRHTRPRRHLEFGTWEGAGTLLCLEECDAIVWTINLPDGEIFEGRPAYASTVTEAPASAPAVYRTATGDVYQTDAGAFIGHRYRSAGLGNRVCQIYCDSREWETSAYPSGFFDSALIDGGHTPEIVLSDTRKALSLVREGGLILWHDFCPDPEVFVQPSVAGVIEGVTRGWSEISGALKDAFWIRPSFLLVGVR